MTSFLQTSFYIHLNFVEMVALLRILSILHIAVCMQVQWLAGNTDNLSEYSVGAISMGSTVDMLENLLKKYATMDL